MSEQDPLLPCAVCGVMSGRSTPRRESIAALIDAMDSVLDDMGKNGLSVCLYTKAQARIALEPFLSPESAEFIMPLSEAERIVKETDNGR